MSLRHLPFGFDLAPSTRLSIKRGFFRGAPPAFCFVGRSRFLGGDAREGRASYDSLNEYRAAKKQRAARRAAWSAQAY